MSPFFRILPHHLTHNFIYNFQGFYHFPSQFPWRFASSRGLWPNTWNPFQKRSHPRARRRQEPRPQDAWLDPRGIGAEFYGLLYMI